VDLSSVKARLTTEFDGALPAHAVSECVEDTATALSREARILSLIPLLAEHNARERLQARVHARSRGAMTAGPGRTRSRS
jgi:hypothetical protein